MCRTDVATPAHLRPEAKPTRTWLIQLGGHSQAELRIVPRETPLAQRRLVLLRQASRYGFTEAGLEYVAKLNLDIYNEPLAELQIDLDPGLKLLTARMGATSLSAHRLVGAGVGERLVLELPNPELGAGREVVVTAFVPLVVDRAWRLPGVRLANAAWQQGTATLEVPRTLVLKRLVTQACVETAVEPLPPPLAGELRRLQLYRPDAFIDVSVGFQPPLLAATSGATLRVNPAVIAGRLVADIAASQGTVFASGRAGPRRLADRPGGSRAGRGLGGKVALDSDRQAAACPAPASGPPGPAAAAADHGPSPRADAAPVRQGLPHAGFRRRSG